MVLSGKNPKVDLFSCPAGQGHLPLSTLLQAPSSLVLDTSREGAVTASLENLCQGLPTLSGNNFFLNYCVQPQRWLHCIGCDFGYSYLIIKITFQCLLQCIQLHLFMCNNQCLYRWCNSWVTQVNMPENIMIIVSVLFSKLNINN